MVDESALELVDAWKALRWCCMPFRGKKEGG
jgi:hypothetical protein